jgi:hypothetical protein
LKIARLDATTHHRVQGRGEKLAASAGSQFGAADGAGGKAFHVAGDLIESQHGFGCTQPDGLAGHAEHH